MIKKKVTPKAAITKKIKTKAVTGKKTAGLSKTGKSSADKSGATKLTAPAKPKKAAAPAGRKKTVAPVKTLQKKQAAPAPGPGSAGKSDKKLSPRDQKLQKIRLILLKQRAALLDEAEMALNELPDQTTFPDLGDQATAETDRNFMLRLRGREQRLLKKIDEAIERIDDNTFGICDDCGNEIDIKRLEARPVTTMCIECKTLQEEEEKLRES
ncbi:MAG: RNA polymerase-binding protein DksA [Nitrospirae bacterium]|nr:RNA polymerase-binding protein DksA [Nitrospirota bacterium]